MKIRVTITIESSLKDEVEALAKVERREFSAQLCALLDEAIIKRGGRK